MDNRLVKSAPLDNRQINRKISTVPENPSKKDTKWNYKLEIAAKDIGESAKSYKLMHIQEAQNAKRKYNRLMIFGIILGPISGVVSSVNTLINPETDPTISIIALILGFLGGVVVAIVKFGKYDESSTSNKQAAARYTSIESNVRRQLGLYRVDRVQALAYMEWLETKYEELFLSAPLLPARVYDKYTKDAKKLGLKVPTQYDAVITINDGHESIKIKEDTNNKTIRVNSELSPESNSLIADADIYLDEKNTNSKPNEKLKRTNTMHHFPQLNQYSDKMLEYEMKRMKIM